MQSTESSSRSWGSELFGFVLLFAAIIFMLALFGLTESAVLDRCIVWTRKFVGHGVYPLTFLLGIGGLMLMFKRVWGGATPRAVPVSAIITIMLSPILHWMNNGNYADAMSGLYGGLVGWTIVSLLGVWWGWLLVIALYAAVMLILIIMLLEWQGQDVVRMLAHFALRLQRWADRILENRSVHAPDEVEASDSVVASSPVVRPLPSSELEPINLPPISLLDAGKKMVADQANIERSIEIIEELLGDFGLVGQVIDVRHGPTLTQFGVEPGYMERPDGTHKKVRIAQIANLRQDFALALAVHRLRIESPVPGRGIVGIEVPNPEASMVRLRDSLESAEFKRINRALAVPLGQDVAGQTVAVNLAKMPHLLIAGTTGSGKSVCMKSLITALVANNTPDQLRLVMIDPKRVEMARFNGLPHLYGSAEVDGERIIGVLRWIVAEMDRRYAVFAQAYARHLVSYNTKMKAQGGRPMPYIVVFIDELADLMAQFSAETERTLCRLAQMARATGIHLVVATQRPSTDVITGLIKANFPARIAFSVATSIDSRVVIDSTGAEQLLGNGDMLFLGSDSSSPKRVQGCFVSDEEIDEIADWWGENWEVDEKLPPPWNDMLARMKLIDDTDDELERAIALCQKHENISTSLLQRRLRVGYPRAARIMEDLYEMGLVEDPKRGGKTRKTYVSEDDGDVMGKLAEERMEERENDEN